MPGTWACSGVTLPRLWGRGTGLCLHVRLFLMVFSSGSLGNILRFGGGFSNLCPNFRSTVARARDGPASPPNYSAPAAPWGSQEPSSSLKVLFWGGVYGCRKPHPLRGSLAPAWGLGIGTPGLLLDLSSICPKCPVPRASFRGLPPDPSAFMSPFVLNPFRIWTP